MSKRRAVAVLCVAALTSVTACSGSSGGPSNDVTPYTNAFLSGATNITIQNQCPNDPVGHIGMFEDSPALQNVLNQLSASPSSSFQAVCSKFGLGL